MRPLANSGLVASHHEATPSASAGTTGEVGAARSPVAPCPGYEEDPSSGALPFPLTTSAKESDSKAPAKRPREEDLPSDDEGLKSNHSESSSPAALVEDDGEKG
jgi:hypothetical protein